MYYRRVEAIVSGEIFRGLFFFLLAMIERIDAWHIE